MGLPEFCKFVLLDRRCNVEEAPDLKLKMSLLKAISTITFLNTKKYGKRMIFINLALTFS